MIELFCGTSTLMLITRQFATCVFALHSPVCSSAAVLQAPHHQPPNQWILGCNWFIFFWQALFVHGKPIFSAKQVTKNSKNIGPGIEHVLCTLWVEVYTTGTTGPPPCTAIVSFRDHVETEGRNFFSKIQRYFGFPHDSNY